MKIVRHRLQQDDGTPVPYAESPNRGGALDHRYLIMHYTAGSSAQGAIASLTDPAAKASAHLVIARDGSVTQLVPFDRVAWHAGRSRWHGLVGLNQYSLGIELDNAGVLEPDDGAWRAWFGRSYPPEEVVEAVHKHEDRLLGWHRYPAEQIEAALAVSRLLVERYGLLDVIGHDDVAPGRKRDPGPAFPMESFRAAVMGRRDDDLELFETVAYLNMREGPGTQFAKLEISPLAPGTRLQLQWRQSSWCFVELLDGTGNPTDSGWVHGDYIRRIGTIGGSADFAHEDHAQPADRLTGTATAA